MPDADAGVPYDGPVEVDETYFGGKRRNMSNAERKAATGRGTVGQDGRRGGQGPGHQSGFRPCDSHYPKADPTGFRGRAHRTRGMGLHGPTGILQGTASP